jgi:hypothetical protein
MEIALVVLSIISISFMIAYIAVVKRLNVVSEAFSKLLITYNMTLDHAQDKQRFESSTEDQDIHKENFIKFLSDSRDWAFDYIENVQKGLSKFIQEVQPQLDYYNKYGVVIEGMVPPHDFALKKISTEFEELKKLLPEETDDRR